MASDSKDESKIQKAEGKALKLKRKSSKSRGGRPYFYSSVVLPPVLPQQQFGSQPTGRGRGLFIPNSQHQSTQSAAMVSTCQGCHQHQDLW